MVPASVPMAILAQAATHPRRSRVLPAQEKGGKPQFPAVVEQGGFTSGRREDPKTLFPGYDARKRVPRRPRRNGDGDDEGGSPERPPEICAGTVAKTASLFRATAARNQIARRALTGQCHQPTVPP